MRDRIWLAAAMDCEGSLQAYDHGRPGLVLQPRLFLGNTNIAIVEEAARIMQTKVRMPTKVYPGRLPYYTTQTQEHRKVLFILMAIEPFLVGKRDKALAMIHAINNKNWILRNSHPLVVATQEEVLCQ